MGLVAFEWQDPQAGNLFQSPSCPCQRMIHKLRHSEAQISVLLGTSPRGGGAGSSPAVPGLCLCQARPWRAAAVAEAAGLLHGKELVESHIQIPICKPHY